MESRKTLVPPPEARQLKVVAVWWWVFVSLCAWLLGSPNCYLTWLPNSLSTPCRLGPPPFASVLSNGQTGQPQGCRILGGLYSGLCS